MDKSELGVLLADIYDAAVDPDGWPRATEHAARAFKATSCLLQSQNRSSGFTKLLGYTENFTPESMREYGSHFYAQDPWATAAMKIGVGAPVIGTELFPEPDLINSPFANDWLRPAGIIDLVGGSIALADGGIGLVGVHRPPDAPRFDRTDQRLMGIFLKHFGRALDIRHRLGNLERRLSVALEALESIDLGIVVVNARGAVRYMNARAEATLAQDDGIVLRQNMLMAKDSMRETKLKRMIRLATLTATGQSISSGGFLSVPRATAKPLAVLISPLSPNFVRPGSLEPVAMVFLDSSNDSKCLPEHVLRSIYGLSSGEAKLALAIVGGETIQEFCERTGIQESTGRTKMKSVFAKTGHTRQSALVRDLTSNPVLRMLRR